jgi:hypothetical protein
MVGLIHSWDARWLLLRHSQRVIHVCGVVAGDVDGTHSAIGTEARGRGVRAAQLAECAELHRYLAALGRSEAPTWRATASSDVRTLAT